MLRPYAVPSCLLALSMFCAGACDTSDSPPPDDDDASELDASQDEGDATTRRDAGADANTRDAMQSASDARAADARTDATASGDAAKPDAGGSDDCVAFVMPKEVDCSAPNDGPLPRDLRCTGLYGDFEDRAVACGLLEYKPAHELWSDAAEKTRWVSIPEGKKVDVSNPMEFVFPDGTRFFKEFRVRDGDGKMRLAETRLIEKRGSDWLYTSYVWSADQKQALQMDNAAGVPNLDGTGHTVPNRDQCNECHGGRNDFVLGWDSVMLGPGATGITREQLVERGLADEAATALAVPGNAVEKAALSYLHANCGISCHNDNPLAKARDTGLYLRLEPNEVGSVQMTDAFTTAINRRPATNAKYEGLANRDPENWFDILPGDPARSLMVARQTIRGTEAQMPRIGTNKIDDAGVQAVTKWIESMTPDAGYPAPSTE